MSEFTIAGYVFASAPLPEDWPGPVFAGRLPTTPNSPLVEILTEGGLLEDSTVEAQRLGVPLAAFVKRAVAGWLDPSTMCAT